MDFRPKGFQKNMHQRLRIGAGDTGICPETARREPSTKRYRSAALCLAVVSLTMGSMPSHAAQKQKFGPMNLEWKGGFKFVGNILEFHDSVALTSESLDLSGETVTLTLAGKSTDVPGAIARGSVVGNPAKGTQVAGRFEQVEEGRTFRIHADKAVYTPEPGRSGVSRIEFTGHVKIVFSSSVALAEPSVTTTDHVTVLLGPKPKPGEPAKYPQLETGPGKATLTPAE
jgi:hypothetical protein